MLESIPYRKPTLALFGVIVVLLFIQALFPRQASPVDPADMVKGECEGEALAVPYAYTGNVVEPWSCKVQCTDQKQRYLLYTNGVATQCEKLPGCNDYGEDRGETCTIPGNASVLEMSSQKSS
jgi:hypothetical protein